MSDLYTKPVVLAELVNGRLVCDAAEVQRLVSENQRLQNENDRLAYELWKVNQMLAEKNHER